MLKNRQERERNDKINKGLHAQQTESENQDGIIPIDDDEIMEEISSVPAGAIDGVLQIQEAFDADIVEDNEEGIFAKWLANGFHFAIEYLEKADIESWKASGKMSFIVDLIKECQIVKDKVVIISHSIACLGKIRIFLYIMSVYLTAPQIIYRNYCLSLVLKCVELMAQHPDLNVKLSSIDFKMMAVSV